MSDRIYLGYLLIWVAVGVFAIWKSRTSILWGAGLTVAFFINMALNHWFGALVWYFPWQAPTASRTLVERGFAISTLGIVAFAIGCFVIAPFLASRSQEIRILHGSPSQKRMNRIFLIIGLGSYLGMVIGLGGVASLAAVLGVGFNFILVTMCLGMWFAHAQNNEARLHGQLALALMLPFFTIVTQGFLGYGVSYAIIVASFYALITRHRFLLVSAALVLGFVALSFYVTYMRDREDIRDAVWGGRDYGTRMERLLETCSTIEWFDPHDRDHLERINIRLNQNWLVGAAVTRIASVKNLAHGETIWMAAFATIPRALWPGKPQYAGSMNLVSEYTGIKFAEGTSVGMGLIFEFYINFGAYGVFVGLLLFGVLVGVADRKAGAELRAGTPYGFARWFIVGIVLINVAGSLAEVTAALGAAAVVFILLNRVLLTDSDGDILQPPPVTPQRRHRDPLNV